jgi:hypothetical protein
MNSAAILNHETKLSEQGQAWRSQTYNLPQVKAESALICRSVSSKVGTDGKVVHGDLPPESGFSAGSSRPGKILNRDRSTKSESGSA